MAQDQVRGSEKLVEERFGKRRQISDETLRQFVELTRKHELQILDWWEYGQPAIDAVGGSVIVKPEVAGRFLDDIFTLDQDLRFNWEAFPYGLPVIDRVVINFKTPGMR